MSEENWQEERLPVLLEIFRIKTYREDILPVLRLNILIIFLFSYCFPLQI